MIINIALWRFFWVGARFPHAVNILRGAAGFRCGTARRSHVLGERHRCWDTLCERSDYYVTFLGSSRFQRTKNRLPADGQAECVAHDSQAGMESVAQLWPPTEENLIRAVVPRLETRRDRYVRPKYFRPMGEETGAICLSESFVPVTPCSGLLWFYVNLFVNV